MISLSHTHKTRVQILRVLMFDAANLMVKTEREKVSELNQPQGSRGQTWQEKTLEEAKVEQVVLTSTKNGSKVVRSSIGWADKKLFFI